jgi:hypothetical protein
LTFVANDSDAHKIFDSTSAAATKPTTSTDKDDQLNIINKCKRSNEISISLCADNNNDNKMDNSSSSSIKYNKNGADCVSDKKKKQTHNGEENDENSDDDDDDSEDLDITKRILKCLSLKVSVIFFG